MAGAVLLLGRVGSLAAQQPTRPQPLPSVPQRADTARSPQQPGDTLPRPKAADTVRVRRDTITIGAPGGGRSDSTRIDSVKGIPDTLRTRVRRDSIQAPIARAEVPYDPGVGRLYRWTRDSVLSTGAVTLGDLLERIPGLTLFRSGFIASAHTASYLGDVARIRIFRDGIELDALSLRAGGIQDVSDYQLSNIDEIAIERAAGEIRVHIRSWTVRNTTAYTRVDAFTGDEDTNLYRFFYGKRFGRGLDAQVGVQQFGTGARDRRIGGGGNVLDALARVGWSRHQWSVDATFNRLDHERNQTVSFLGQDSLLPRSQVRRNESYVRVAYGDPDSSLVWGQLIASTTSQRQSGTGYTALDSTIVYRQSAAPLSRGRRTVRAIDTVAVADSALSRTQYVVAGGYTLGRVRVSGTDRLRGASGVVRNTPSARVAFDSRRLTISAFAELDGVGGPRRDSALVTRRDSFPLYVIDTVRANGVTRVDSVRRDTLVRSTDTTTRYLLARPDRLSRVDLSARLSPLPWFSVLASVSRDRRTTYAVTTSNTDTSRTTVVADSAVDGAAVMTSRLEAAVRLHDVWISGGVIRRGATTVHAPTVYECLRGGTACSDSLPDATRPIAFADPAVNGGIFAARGRLYKDTYIDAIGTVWQSGGAYRPQYQLRGEFGLRSNWLRRFPNGNFGFKTAIIDEYRSRTYFPTPGDAPTTDSTGAAAAASRDVLFAPPSNVVTVQLEIRILSGTLSYQLRNALNRRYELVPGFVMPGAVNFYGLRWTFWN